MKTASTGIGTSEVINNEIVSHLNHELICALHDVSYYAIKYTVIGFVIGSHEALQERQILSSSQNTVNCYRKHCNKRPYMLLLCERPYMLIQHEQLYMVV